jgi:glutamine amidotransferase
MGNLLSVSRAFEKCNTEIVLANSAHAIEQADFLVLPGVGAFADGMSELKARGFIDPIKEFVAKERPFLGICLGMQMMLGESEEFGASQGLGIVPGRVEAIPRTGLDGRPHKIPHVGWNELIKPESISWSDSILAGTAETTSFYFVHSFTAAPLEENHRLADCFYNGRLISAAIRSGSIYGCQFHPEKSGLAGLKVIEHFLSA